MFCLESLITHSSVLLVIYFTNHKPTSGLDSYSAMQLIKVLKKVAKAGSSVLFTIHQPSSDVFNSFDQILLMNNGRVMATGEVEDLYTFFQMRGQPVPNHYNPADWMMVSPFPRVVRFLP